MNTITITINGEEYLIKQTIRAMFIYETIINKPFEVKTMLDSYVYFYSLILANNPDKVLDWNDFLDALDTDPSIYKAINDAVLHSSKIDELLDGEKTENGSKKN